MANTYTGNSIVDYLNSTGQKSDFAYRSGLAKELGIQNYTGSAAQNAQMLEAVRGAAGNTGGSTGGNTGSTNTGGNTGGNTNTGNTGGVTKPEPTGNPNVDALQSAFHEVVTGSLATGFTINPALSITPEVLNQFITETANQLDPRYRQIFDQEKRHIDQTVNALAVDYQNNQGKTIQDFQQTLGTIRDTAGAKGTYLGGGQRALEQGLLNSANRSLSSLDVNAAKDIGEQLQAGGVAMGQGIAGTNSNGLNLGGINTGAGSLNVPSIYGRTLNLGGGDSVFSGSSNTTGPLNFNYNPSNYQYGSFGNDYTSNFTNLLNQTAGNYIQGQIATGGANQALSKYGLSVAYGGK